MNSVLDSPPSCNLDFDGFERQVRTSVRLLFGSHDPAGAVFTALDRLRVDVQRLNERGLGDVPSIALVGAVGEGKSWLARAFLNSDGARKEREEVSTGQNASDRTHQLLWYGPQTPLGLATGERHLQVESSCMLDLGRPYLLADTPGFTDSDSGAWRLSEVSVTSAPIKLLVTSRSQLRDGGVEDFAATLNGSVVLPVVRFETTQTPDGTCSTIPSKEALAEVNATLDKWRKASPDSYILPACFMPMARIFGVNAAEKLMRERIQMALRPLLSDKSGLKISVQRQATNRMLVCKQEIADALEPFRQRVSSAVENLQSKTESLPERVFAELAGEQLILHVIIRQHLRADWMERTPVICFPYRSFSGLFGLTQGAWDKVFFASAGSIPSLVSAMARAVRNLRDGKAPRVEQDGENELVTHLNNLLIDELRPEIRKFEAAVSTLMPERAKNQIERDADARLHGLQALAIETPNLLRAKVEKFRPTTTTILLLAILGTVLFFYLVAGPVASLYRNYLQAHDAALGEAAGLWSDFPHPSASMLLSSLLLSTAPSILLAMIGMAWCCSNRRIKRIAGAFRQALDVAIRERFATGSLRIEVDEPGVEAARFLLSLTKKK